MSRVLSFYPEHAATLPARGEIAIKFTLSRLDLPKSEYFVIGGANLVLRQIIEVTPDIDMLVSDRGFGRLVRMPHIQLKQPPLRARVRGATNQTVWVEDPNLAVPVSATTSLGDGYYPMSFKTHQHSVEEVQDIPCLNLGDVIASKEALQRPVDLRHLGSIAQQTGLAIFPLAPPSITSPVPIS